MNALSRPLSTVPTLGRAPWRRLASLAVLAGAAALLLAAAPARAQLGGEPPAADKSGYHPFNPAPRELLREMSTDRPDTTESPYSVDAGRFQIELSLVDYTRDRSDEGSETRRTLAAVPLLVKVGLREDVDLQLGIDPYTRERTTDRATDSSQTVEGFGDTVLRLKVNLWGNDGGDTAFALMPFVKLPTAGRDLGNGDVEGGLIAPLAIALPRGLGLGLMAELDGIRNAADDGYVVDFLHTVTVASDLVGDLGGFVEYAGFASLDGDEDYRGYFDAGLTYGLTPDLQLDAGIRVGLTEAAEDFGVFTGVSRRF